MLISYFTLLKYKYYKLYKHTLVLYRFGRKFAMIFGSVMSAALCIVQSFSINFPMFLAFEFLSSVISCGVYTVSFVLGKTELSNIVYSAYTYLKCNIFNAICNLNNFLIEYTLKRLFQQWSWWCLNIESSVFRCWNACFQLAQYPWLLSLASWKTGDFYCGYLTLQLCYFYRTFGSLLYK